MYLTPYSFTHSSISSTTLAGSLVLNIPSLIPLKQKPHLNGQPLVAIIVVNGFSAIIQSYLSIGNKCLAGKGSLLISFTMAGGFITISPFFLWPKPIILLMGLLFSNASTSSGIISSASPIFIKSTESKDSTSLGSVLV